MEERYDQFDEQRARGGRFVMALLAGTVIGVGLGLLFAPKAGSELRGRLSDEAERLANTASEGLRKANKAAGDWAAKGHGLYDKARDAVARGADEAQRYTREAIGGPDGQGLNSGSPESLQS